MIQLGWCIPALSLGRTKPWGTIFQGLGAVKCSVWAVNCDTLLLSSGNTFWMPSTINCCFIGSAYITSELKSDPKSQVKNTSHTEAEYQKVSHFWVRCCNRNNYKLHGHNWRNLSVVTWVTSRSLRILLARFADLGIGVWNVWVCCFYTPQSYAYEYGHLRHSISNSLLVYTLLHLSMQLKLCVLRIINYLKH